MCLATYATVQPIMWCNSFFFLKHKVKIRQSIALQYVSAKVWSSTPIVVNPVLVNCICSISTELNSTYKTPSWKAWAALSALNGRCPRLWCRSSILATRWFHPAIPIGGFLGVERVATRCLHLVVNRHLAKWKCCHRSVVCTGIIMKIWML